ncbi:hypothetical protein Acsp06_12690 [Actinomycetospora sp. NBRC 106375]|uniref:hypothetical protein n=1 Tax=Actinomycetospora sp. NBRC 106375 TaxID=3032207 RepID=UPI0024A15D7B|nr:hypothetical protein [Actinomycetospora sp. NBRC 106375]GLZ45084.1 hypothetical protein Acsp06_12690 [Actinomycetospora sp. NBRC 106375]
MLVLAPDPRLGIAPERVTRVRGLLEQAEAGAPVPGVVVALPGGPDGVLDAVVLRPDGVLGLAALPAGERELARDASREAVAAGGGRAGLATPATGLPRARSGAPDTVPPTARESADELDRLLALPDPACGAPRRVLATVGDDEAGVGATRTALTAPVGSFRVLDVEDVRRLLAAFRLGDHVPDGTKLAEVGFLAPGTPALEAGAVPETAPVPVPTSRSSDSSPGTSSSPGSSGSPGRTPLPATGRLPASAPESSGPLRGGAIGGMVSAPGRAGRSRYGGRLPDWVWGWRGLTLAAVAAFLVALGIAFLVGRAATGGSAEPDPTATRVVDGITFTRQVATSDASCDGHAYRQAAAFLRERPCRHLDRSLWSATADGQDIVVAVATVQLADTNTAGAFRSLVDSDGTGNISDLLRERRGYPGAPDGLTGQGYASAQLGDRVVVAEADGIDPAFTDGDALDRISRAGLALR